MEMVKLTLPQVWSAKEASLILYFIRLAQRRGDEDNITS